MATAEHIEARLAEKALRRARLTYALYPIGILFILLAAPVPFAYVHLFDYRQIMPDVLAIASVGVMFVGAFWDFGAKMYVKELVDHNIPFGDDDLAYVFKQQFMLTVIYLLIGLSYFAVAFLIYAF